MRLSRQCSTGRPASLSGVPVLIPHDGALWCVDYRKRCLCTDANRTILLSPSYCAHIFRCTWWKRTRRIDGQGRRPGATRARDIRRVGWNSRTRKLHEVGFIEYQSRDALGRILLSWVKRVAPAKYDHSRGTYANYVVSSVGMTTQLVLMESNFLRPWLLMSCPSFPAFQTPHSSFAKLT